MITNRHKPSGKVLWNERYKVNFVHEQIVHCQLTSGNFPKFSLWTKVVARQVACFHVRKDE